MHHFEYDARDRGANQKYGDGPTHSNTNAHMQIFESVLTENAVIVDSHNVVIGGYDVESAGSKRSQRARLLACIGAQIGRTCVTGDEQSGDIVVAGTKVAASQWSEGQLIDLDAHEDGDGAQITEGSARASVVDFIAVDIGAG